MASTVYETEISDGGLDLHSIVTVFYSRKNQFCHEKINFISAKSISPRQIQFHYGKIIFTFHHGKIVLAYLFKLH